MQQGFPGDGAGGGGRTRTVSPPLDFESSTSANSITPAYILFRTVSKSSLRKSEGDLEGDFEKTRFIRLSKALIYKGFRVSPEETATRILSPARLPIPSHRHIQLFFEASRNVFRKWEDFLEDIACKSGF